MTSEYEPKVNTHPEGEQILPDDEDIGDRNDGWDGKFDYENALSELAGEAPAWSSTLTDDEWDFLDGKTCNPDAPEECESCQ